MCVYIHLHLYIYIHICTHLHIFLYIHVNLYLIYSYKRAHAAYMCACNKYVLMQHICVCVWLALILLVTWLLMGTPLSVKLFHHTTHNSRPFRNLACRHKAVHVPPIFVCHKNAYCVPKNSHDCIQDSSTLYVCVPFWHN